MHIYLCIDDTDNLDSRGTGELATIIMDQIEERGWGKCTRITRHQLLVHPDIPYTSHNSSMCFEAEVQEECLDLLVSYAQDFLTSESAEGSDPGLCITAADKIADPEKLIAFGKKAKSEIVKKQEAYDIAAELGIHLSEHGGTGGGVIGALAGVGLRLSGNDGSFKGHIRLGCDDREVSAGFICSNTFVKAVKSIDGTELQDSDMISIGDCVKAVLQDGKPTLLVSLRSSQYGTYWETCTKRELKVF